MNMGILKRIKRIFLSDEDMVISEKRAMENLQTSILYEIGRAMSSSMIDKEETHRLITEAVIMVLQVERSILMLKEEKGENLAAEAWSGIVDEDIIKCLKIKIGEGIVGKVAESGEPYLVRDAASEDIAISSIIDKLQVKSFLVAPLKMGDNILGVITADTKRSGEPFDDGDLKLLSVLAGLAAIAEDNALLIERLKDKASRLKVLFDIGQAMNSTLKLQELLDLIIDRAIDVTKASSGSIMLIDSKENRLIIRSARGLSADMMKNVRLKVGEGVTGWVAEKGMPLLVPDVFRDDRYRSVNEKVRSELAVPMIQENDVIGVINVDHYELDAFSASDMEILSTLASAATVAIRNAWLFEKLKECSASLNEAGGKA